METPTRYHLSRFQTRANIQPEPRKFGQCIWGRSSIVGNRQSLVPQISRGKAIVWRWALKRTTFVGGYSRKRSPRGRTNSRASKYHSRGNSGTFTHWIGSSWYDFAQTPGRLQARESLIPHLLTDEQKRQRVKWCQFTLKKFNGDRSKLVSKIATGDKT